MKDHAEVRFRRELNSFFGLTLLNVIFAAQAIALGVSYVVAAIAGTPGVPAFPALRALAGAIALVCFGLGLAWIRSSAVILRGVTRIRRPFRRRGGSPNEEDVTRGIVEMVAHYRENRRTIRAMVLVCAAGGLVFLAQGVAGLLGLVVPLGPETGAGSAIVAASLVTGALGLAGLLSAHYFSRYARTWDERLERTARAEDALEHSMGAGSE